VTPEEREAALLADLAGVLDLAASLVARGRDAYDEDPALQLAFEALSIRAGEVVKRLSAIEPQRYADGVWSGAARNRDLIAHHYEAIDVDALWATTAVYFPELAEEVRRRRRA